MADAGTQSIPWHRHRHVLPRSWAGHFHAIYGDFEITVEIESGRINGNFPKRALTHVLEWKELHRVELLEAWLLARASRPLPRIDPLE